MYWFIIIATAIASMFVSNAVRSNFAKYSRVPNAAGMSGAEVASLISRQNGLDIDVELSSGGPLSDHYDPRTKAIYLSPDVYHGRSVAAASISAHEMGHALQHANNFAPLEARNSIYPIVALASGMWVWVFMLGVFVLNATNSSTMMMIGIMMFGAVVLFQLITLPVEFNASERALQQLQQNNIITEDQLPGSKKMLSSAATTYIVAALASLAQLVYLLSGSRRRS